MFMFPRFKIHVCAPFVRHVFTCAPRVYENDETEAALPSDCCGKVMVGVRSLFLFHSCYNPNVLRRVKMIEGNKDIRDVKNKIIIHIKKTNVCIIMYIYNYLYIRDQ